MNNKPLAVIRDIWILLLTVFVLTDSISYRVEILDLRTNNLEKRVTNTRQLSDEEIETLLKAFHNLFDRVENIENTLR